MRRRTGKVAVMALMLLMGGCADLPRDQDGWTERVRQSGVLTVGVSHEGEEAPEGLEAHEKRLVEAVAERLGARRVEWRRGNAHQLLEDLEKRGLPLVAATLPSDSPFSQKVGMSQPYLKKGPGGKDYCLAVAPGENRLLLLVDQVIAGEREGARPR